MRAFFALAFAAALLACGGAVPMGGTCDATEDCAGDGVCLNGACSAYACASDEDCEADHVCGQVGGTDVCVLPCTSDDDCAGEQTCHDVAVDEAGDARGRVCL